MLLRALLVLSLGSLLGTSNAATWADPSKVLHVAFGTDVTGFDPAATQDSYSNTIEARIFDTLYRWDYLARPYRLVPSIAAAMPEYSADGRTWTIRLRPGIYFSDDPVFKGRKRELVAADVVYSWKRLMDPRVRSPSADYLKGEVVGLDAAAEKAKSTGRFDYDAEIEGLHAIDRYTLQVKLEEPDYALLYYLDWPAFSVVAREVVERYGDASGRVMDHPVGSNAYRLEAWRRGQKVILEANPNFREVRFPEAPPDADPHTKAIAAAMRGKRLPQIGTVEVSIVEEGSARLLMFDRKELDLLNVPRELAPRVIDANGKLLPQYARRGVDAQRATELAVSFTYFNMEDPVVGGYSLDKVALRRAVCSAYDIDDEIRIVRQGQARPATQPIPPDLEGHVPGYKGFSPYDPFVSRALLDRFGYRDRNGDGFREAPDGRPLVLHFASEPDATSRQYDELWQRSLAAIGLKVEFPKQQWSEQLKAASEGKLQIWSVGTSSDNSDYYMLQFYGPSAGNANLPRFRNAEFDELFRKSRRVRGDAERAQIYAKMTDILGAYAPWCPEAFRVSTTLAAPWVVAYEKNVHYYYPPWEYLDIDRDRQRHP